MSWSSPERLRAQLQQLWDQGELLSSLVTGISLFPKRLRLKAPSSAEISLHFDEVRDWIAQLRALPHYRLEMREFKHRIFGNNAVPHEVWIDSAEHALALLARQHEASRFAALIAVTRQQQPQLLAWLAQRPLQALALSAEWQRLLDLVGYLQRHPRPGIYLRQIELPGVHSKFIESHRAVLTELLDLSLPPAAINCNASGLSQFASRYGLRDKPLRVRFRLLDSAHALLPGDLPQDITLDADSFAQLDAALSGIRRVFITENEINFLAFPPRPDSLVIFGAGYGFAMLAKAAWLARCRLYYWGDIDTHGFAILDQLRGQFAQTSSFLMDRATLMAHVAHWGAEPQATSRDLARLNEAESALYNDLRDQRLSKNLRLEQERIGFQWLVTALAALP